MNPVKFSNESYKVFKFTRELTNFDGRKTVENEYHTRRPITVYIADNVKRIEGVILKNTGIVQEFESSMGSAEYYTRSIVKRYRAQNVQR